MDNKWVRGIGKPRQIIQATKHSLMMNRYKGVLHPSHICPIQLKYCWHSHGSLLCRDKILQKKFRFLQWDLEDTEVIKRRLPALFPDSNVREDRKMSYPLLRKGGRENGAWDITLQMRLPRGRNLSRLWVKSSLSLSDVFRGNMEEIWEFLEN